MMVPVGQETMANVGSLVEHYRGELRNMPEGDDAESEELRTNHEKLLWWADRLKATKRDLRQNRRETRRILASVEAEGQGDAQSN